MTAWAASADTTVFSPAVGPGVNRLDQSLSAAVLDPSSPTTIVRVRGEIWVRSDQDAVNETGFGALGFAVVNDNARAAGAASILGPITNEAADQWFVHQFFNAGNVGPTTGALFGNPWHRYSFDSKAMRKVEEGDAIVVMVENAAVTFSFEFLLKFRLLLKLH